jgi:hypothetical protein
MLARPDFEGPRWDLPPMPAWVPSRAGFRGPEHLVTLLDRDLDSFADDGIVPEARLSPLITVLLVLELTRGLIAAIRSRGRSGPVGSRIS